MAEHRKSNPRNVEAGAPVQGGQSDQGSVDVPVGRVGSRRVPAERRRPGGVEGNGEAAVAELIEDEAAEARTRRIA